MDRIRYGMVGGGDGSFIGAVHRLGARLDDRFELVCGAFSGDAESSMRKGLELGLANQRCYPDYESLFEGEAALPMEQRMQCVVIVTPNHLHYPVAVAALSHGFHVISDKPATLTLDECQRLADLVTESGALYALTHPYTGYPLVREARDLVAAGELGKIRKVIVEYTQGWLSEPIERDGNRQAVWRTDPQRAGISGCMGDIGVHAFNLLEYVSGLEAARVSADLNIIVEDRALDDDGVVLLKLSNGASGLLFASQVCVGEENNLRLRIYGDKGSLDWRQEEPNTLWLKYPDQPARQMRTGNAYLGTAAASATRIPAGHPEGYLEAFANVYDGIAGQLQTSFAGDPVDISAFAGIREALRGMAFIEAVVKSSAGGNAWLNLPSNTSGADRFRNIKSKI